MKDMSEQSNDCYKTITKYKIGYIVKQPRKGELIIPILLSKEKEIYPGETIESFKITLDKDWMRSPDIITKTVEHHTGTRPDISRTGELKFFENNKELESNDPDLWNKVDSTTWARAYDKSGEGMPDYIKDIYSKRDLYEAALPKLAMTEKRYGKIIILGTGGEVNKDWHKWEWGQGVRQHIKDDNLSRTSRKSKQGNRLFRRLGKIMRKAQVFLAKRKSNFLKRSSDI